MLEAKNVGGDGLFGKSSLSSGTHRDADVHAARKWFNDQVARARKVGKFSIWATLSPALAEALIRHSMPEDSNRALRPGKVARLALAINAGQWDGNTHQGLAFTTEGIVNDGQHRIHAVKEAGTPIEIMMTFGQPRQTFEVIDQEMVARTAADLLHMDGLQTGSPNVAASVARWLFAKRRGGNLNDAVRESNRQDVLTFAREHTQLIREAVSRGCKVAHGIKSKVSPSNLSTAFFLIAEAGAAAVKMDEFASLLAMGNIAEKNSPILLCREGLRNGEFGHHLRNNSDSKAYQIAAVVLAWNKWRQGGACRSSNALKIKSVADFPAARP